MSIHDTPPSWHSSIHTYSWYFWFIYVRVIYYAYDSYTYGTGYKFWSKIPQNEIFSILSTNFYTEIFGQFFDSSSIFFGGGTIALLSPPPPLLHDTTKHIDKRAAYIDRRPHTCRPMACSMIILYRTLNFKFKLVVVGGSFSVRCAVGNRRPHICWHMAWLRMCYIIMLTVEPLPWNI